MCDSMVAAPNTALQVKANFERFISCKDTIDDIHQRLRRLETEHRGGVSTEHVYDAVLEVCRQWHLADRGLVHRALGGL